MELLYQRSIEAHADRDSKINFDNSTFEVQASSYESNVRFVMILNENSNLARFKANLRADLEIDRRSPIEVSFLRGNERFVIRNNKMFVNYFTAFGLQPLEKVHVQVLPPKRIILKSS
jgi:hypothetical protein